MIGLNASWSLAPAHLAGELSNDSATEYLVWTGYQPSDSVGKGAPNVTVREALFSAEAPIVLERCMYSVSTPPTVAMPLQHAMICVAVRMRILRKSS